MNCPYSHSHVSVDAPKVIAWELTRRCMLKCKHCRGAAKDYDYSGEFSTDECKKVIDSISSFCKPILIMTGGEPMMRDDIFELSAYASSLGITPVLAPCGHLIDKKMAKKIKESGIRAISISLDGADAESHDAFRGVAGAYERTMRGLRCAIDEGIPFQINTTVTRHNIEQLPAILQKAIDLGAKTFDLFFLVPTGRGKELLEQEISPKQQERALQWVWEQSRISPIRVKTTCAPHYARIQKQQLAMVNSGGMGERIHPQADIGYVSGGCMGGKGFVFISHRGILQPCGFLDLPCGDLRAGDYDFKRLYEESKVFQDLRNLEIYGGKCGECEYCDVCGGCRARAYAHSGDYLAQEPGCSYVPKSLRKGSGICEGK